jgi:adenylosuccinate lyase
MTRGKAMTADLMRDFIATLEIPDAAKQSLLDMTPATYIGNAVEQARAIRD